jgi:hypothetical protein
MAGLRSEPRGVERQSMTTRLVMPVDSSADSCTDEAVDQILERRTVPSTSVMIGRVYGSHSARSLAALHLVALVDHDLRTVGDTMRCTLLALLVAT